MEEQPRFFSVKVVPYPDEALSSYILRAASNNGVDTVWFMNSHRSSNSDNIKLSDLARLDFVPYNILDLAPLEEKLSLRPDTMVNYTFLNIIKKLCDSSKPEDSRVMKGLIRRELVFCPECLKERTYYKLKWRLEGFDFCLKHSNRLLRECATCKKKIKYTDINKIGYCPYCFKKIAKQVSESIYDCSSHLEEQRVKEEIINELLMPYSQRIESRELSLKILYLSDYLPQQPINQEKLMVNTNYMLQYARDSMASKRSLHLSVLANILYSAKITYKDLLCLKVPEDFVAEIYNKKSKPQSEDFACQAPWCINYSKTGLLNKTGTRSKKQEVSKFTMYMYCPRCGCAYALSNGSLFERSNFIKGYESLKDVYKTDFTWRQVSHYTGLSLAKNRRIIAYFKGQGLLTESKYNYNDQLLMRITQSLNDGVKLTEIQSWSSWDSGEQFLIYRYHPLVMTAAYNQPIKQPARIDNDELMQKVMLVCEQLVSAKQKITNEAVSKAVGVSSNTISNRGLQVYINKMKHEQKMQMHQDKIKTFKRKIDDFFDKVIDPSISIEELYLRLKLSQNYLCNYAPEINNYIRIKRNESLSKTATYSL
ncbi:TniQ family protein [Paenibacillus sp. B01]|uniref:TniQ family protein n=1 Tax=Paenibacillus sp. B01 TaxID=2660554 RepID=UPI00129B19C2|nr:TniQ family protein [Paenibacillus sp. B01]QGG55063.1 hypothetical protein GE073_05340 [Paenibacillus sp. B01]